MIRAFIPVRGGSKSIPLKNIKEIHGYPLIYWSAKAASQSSSVDQVIIATDSEEIVERVLSFKLPKVTIYRRNNENAQDHSSTESVMLEYIRKSDMEEQDLFLLIQATSPFTQAVDIDAAIESYKNNSYDSLLSVVENKRFYWNSDGTPVNYDYKNRPRRQDFDGYLMENGAFYLNSVSNILKYNNRLSGKVGFHIMPEYTGFEIDEPDDWIICEGLMDKHISSVRDRAYEKIKLFATDVDGVLTDAGMYYGEKGDELKKFNTRDGMGFELLRNHGIKTAIITSEDTEIVARRAKKLKVDSLHQGIRNKLECAQELCRKMEISLDEMAYIGDDINDRVLLQKAGLTAIPSDAAKEIFALSQPIHLTSKGGEGVFREFVEYFLKERTQG